MLRYLSVDITCSAGVSNSFPRVLLEENCKRRGTDSVQGKISKHIFGPNYYYRSDIFATLAVLKIGEYHSDIRQS